MASCTVRSWHTTTIRTVLLIIATLVTPTLFRTASAQTNTITITRVWAQDEKGQEKSVFLPGDPVQYATVVNNTYSHTVKATIRFEAAGPALLYTPTMENPVYRSIYVLQADVELPVGLSSYYSPLNIPDDAQPGPYGIGITVGWPSDSDTGGYSRTVNYGSFSIPGSLATNITTYLTDRGTPTSTPDKSVGAGGALAYKVTITNVSSAVNTNVLFTDPLPQEIFALISYPDASGTVMPPVSTNHGTCNTRGAWSPTSNSTITCQLDNLAPGETATITFTASIIVRSPSGAAAPPSNFVNRVYVTSDQQSLDMARATINGSSAYILTLIDLSIENSAAIQQAINMAVTCAGAIIKTIPGAGLVWALFGPQVAQVATSPSHNICFTPKTEIQRLVGTGSKKALIHGIDLAGHKVGMGLNIVSKVLSAEDAARCSVDTWKLWYDQNPDNTIPESSSRPCP